MLKSQASGTAATLASNSRLPNGDTTSIMQQQSGEANSKPIADAPHSGKAGEGGLLTKVISSLSNTGVDLLARATADSTGAAEGGTINPTKVMECGERGFLSAHIFNGFVSS